MHKNASHLSHLGDLSFFSSGYGGYGHSFESPGICQAAGTRRSRRINLRDWKPDSEAQTPCQTEDCWPMQCIVSQRKLLSKRKPVFNNFATTCSVAKSPIEKQIAILSCGMTCESRDVWRCYPWRLGLASRNRREGGTGRSSMICLEHCCWTTE